MTWFPWVEIRLVGCFDGLDSPSSPDSNCQCPFALECVSHLPVASVTLEWTTECRDFFFTVKPNELYGGQSIGRVPDFAVRRTRNPVTFISLDRLISVVLPDDEKYTVRFFQCVSHLRVAPACGVSGVEMDDRKARLNAVLKPNAPQIAARESFESESFESDAPVKGRRNLMNWGTGSD